MPDLRATVVIDYQNVHLTGHELFARTRDQPRHESLVDPLHFANQLVATRNRAQQPGMDHAVLAKVLAYRGQPSPEHDPVPHARSQAQRAHWERDQRVQVHLRALKYDFVRDREGRPLLDAAGHKVVASRREKGVDVLCALAVVREARDGETDLVVLASHDTDLEPALDEALAVGTAKIETFTWHDRHGSRRTRQLRPRAGRRLWNTRLGETEFLNSRDRTLYA